MLDLGNGSLPFPYFDCCAERSSEGVSACGEGGLLSAQLSFQERMKGWRNANQARACFGGYAYAPSPNHEYRCLFSHSSRALSRCVARRLSVINS